MEHKLFFFLNLLESYIEKIRHQVMIPYLLLLYILFFISAIFMVLNLLLALSEHQQVLSVATAVLTISAPLCHNHTLFL